MKLIDIQEQIFLDGVLGDAHLLHLSFEDQSITEGKKMRGLKGAAAAAAIMGACFGAGCEKDQDQPREKPSAQVAQTASPPEATPEATPEVEPETGSIKGNWSNDFIAFVKRVENAGRDGWNSQNRRWYPHTSPEGGLPTIAWGHKATSQAEANRLRSQGLTENEANQLLEDDLATAWDRADSYVRSKHNVSLDTLPGDSQEMLVDFAFNLGSLNGFPKFTRAVVEEDWEAAKREYERTYKDENDVRHSLARNADFYDRYLDHR